MNVVDFDEQVTVVLMPAKPREGRIQTVAQERKLREAIRLVMELLPRCKRSRALVRTTDRSLFSAEIEAFYAPSLFRQQSLLSRCA